MYVCMYVCMYLYIPDPYTFTCVYVCMHTHIHMQTQMHEHVHIHIHHIHIHVCTLSLHLDMYIYMQYICVPYTVRGPQLWAALQGTCKKHETPHIDDVYGDVQLRVMNPKLRTAVGYCPKVASYPYGQCSLFGNLLNTTYISYRHPRADWRDQIYGTASSWELFRGCFRTPNVAACSPFVEAMYQ